MEPLGQLNAVALIALQLFVFLILLTIFVRRSTPRRAWGVVAVLISLTATLALLWKSETDRQVEAIERRESAVPHLDRSADGFVTSDTCQACHPDQYASWHASYHRTMTTVATPETVKGNFDSVTLESRGRTYMLERRADEFWVEMVDPDRERELRLRGDDADAVPDPPRVSRQIVMTTGSHHMQTYWVPSTFGQEVYNVPFVYVFEDARWIPRDDVFLRPPNAGRMFALWNNSCIDCHSTAGKVGFDRDAEVFDSSVAEMGIACEACHGPAEEHVRLNRDPARRYQLHLTDAVDESIVHPERLDQRAASQICGQCHGVAVSEDPEEWLENGHGYRAGHDLEDTRYMVRPAVDGGSTRMRELLEIDPSAVDTRFWSDGMVRVSGREMSGMLESACFQRGDLTCLSCHSMHESADLDDQLAPGFRQDEACLQCHETYRVRIEDHSRHEAESEGSRCYNCHMPHTTYGLLKAIRSHWIDSPSVAASVDTGRPNACNLCHLDKTLAWTADALSDQYGVDSPSLPPAESSVAASLLWLLRGDAGQRALAAWSMGWEPALQASGRGWLAPYLATVLTDPYSTVRYIAERSLRSQPAYANLDYDFIDDYDSRVQAREEVLDMWFALPVDRLDRTGAHLFIDAQGNLDYEAFFALARQRDDRPVVLAE